MVGWGLRVGEALGLLHGTLAWYSCTSICFYRPPLS